MMRKLAVFRGHQADVTCAAWHPWHEGLCVSGSYDGNILHWLVSHPSEPQVGSRDTMGRPHLSAYVGLPADWAHLGTVALVLYP